MHAFTIRRSLFRSHWTRTLATVTMTVHAVVTGPRVTFGVTCQLDGRSDRGRRLWTATTELEIVCRRELAVEPTRQLLLGVWPRVYKMHQDTIRNRLQRAASHTGPRAQIAMPESPALDRVTYR